MFALVSVGLGQSSNPAFDSAATPGLTQPTAIATGTTQAEAPGRVSREELESLVASIALYPDALLIQVLAASTYPLEVIQLKQWLDENKKLNGNALAEAVAQQNWDPSVQALAAFPGVVNKLANKIQWTTDLGNAFLAQEFDLMDAVQTLRATAQENGALKSNDKQRVQTESRGDGQQAITIEPAQQSVIYVPTYRPQAVYRDTNSSAYSGYSADSDDAGYSGSGSDSGYSYVGYAVAAAYGAYWGEYNWRDRYAEVNYDNYYNHRHNNHSDNKWDNQTNNSGNNDNSGNHSWNNRSNNGSHGDRTAQRGNEHTGRWQHDPSHRGSAPYRNRDLAGRFGQGNNRFGQGAGNRPFDGRETNAVNQLARGNRPSQMERANAGNQLGRGNFSAGPRGANSSLRPPNGAEVNRVGNRLPSSWPKAERGGAFGPENGNAARAFSARGAQSMRPPGELRGGPPGGMRAGGPPMGGFRGAPPMGGGLPMGGGPPMGGAPPPPPPHP